MANDKEEIQKNIQTFCSAFVEGNAVKLASLFKTDADFVSIFGIHLKGRAAIEQAYTDVFSKMGKKSAISVEGLEIKFLTPEVATCFVPWKRDFMGSNGSPAGRGLMQLVAHREASTWQFASAQNTETETPSGTQPQWQLSRLKS